MAPDSSIAKLLAHIAACHSASLPGDRLALFSGPHHIGYVAPDLAGRLLDVSAAVTRIGDRLNLAPSALPELNAIAARLGLNLRGEDFDVRETPGGPALAVLDRGALPGFGVIGIGVHLNGIVRRPDGIHLWVGRRAADKKLDPGKLDHLVAGGVPAGLTPLQTLIKEAEEEASLPAALLAGAKLAARFAYNMERAEGLRRDVVYAYDLELPESFVPVPADGEVECFSLWPLAQVLEVMASSDDFKFNVNLVLIDLCIRQGLITGENARLLGSALHRRVPAP